MTQPVEQQDQAEIAAVQRRPWVGLVLLGLLAVAAVVLVVSFVRGGQGSSAPAMDVATASGAENVCTARFVPQKLKAPATAAFAAVVAREDPAEAGTYTVTGAVDAQNSFGAQVRSRFECRVRYAGGGSWTLDRVSIN